MKFFFRTMNLIYSTFVVSSLIIVGISIYLWNFELEIQNNLSPIKTLILMFFVLISTVFAQYIYNKNLSRVGQNDHVTLKLQTYQTASIYRLSILESTLIITVLFFIFSKMWIILIPVIILLILIIFSRPSKKAFLNFFRLSEQELKI